MKPWPDKSEFFGIPDGREDYERARAEAAIERLRSAQLALEILSRASWDAVDVRVFALSELENIGEVP